MIFGIRPEHIHHDTELLKASPQTTIKVKINVVELTGAEMNLYSAVAGQDLLARVVSKIAIKSGDEIDLCLDIRKGHFFDKETQMRISN